MAKEKIEIINRPEDHPTYRAYFEHALSNGDLEPEDMPEDLPRTSVNRLGEELKDKRIYSSLKTK